MKAPETTDQAALFRTLREVLKSKGYTYARLARELGVSEVTIKRVFAARSCSLERLMAICERVGVSFLEVAALARSDEEVDHVLTPAQESYFAANPSHFGILKDLNQGASARELGAEWKLPAPRLHKILRALEKLGLLEVFEGDRIRLRFRGNLRMSHRGPLARKILRPQTLAFLDHIDRVLEHDDVCLHSAETGLSDAHVAELVEEIHALGRKYRARAFRDRSLHPRKKLRPVRWLFAFAPYRSDWPRL
jgi:transcriptional regulator with XRE-family HTH domain